MEKVIESYWYDSLWVHWHCGVGIVYDMIVDYSSIVSWSRLSSWVRVWSISHHHLVSNTPRISWRVNWVSDKWRCVVAFFGMLFRESEDLPLQNASQFMFTPTSLDALLLSMPYKSLMRIWPDSLLPSESLARLTLANDIFANNSLTIQIP